MYTYDLDATDHYTNASTGERVSYARHRSYRPDLLPVVMRWLSYVPESEWQHFVGFRVGDRGQFIAKFMKAPTQGGALRLITFTVDHNFSEMRTNTGRWWDAVPVAPTTANLQLAADTF
jgi:hypothetical protein